MCVCVFLSAFFSATAEPFALKFAMVFPNSAGKILSKFLGPMVEYLPSYGTIKGSGSHKKVKVTQQCIDFV